MPFIPYIQKRFNKSSLLSIERANSIIAEYQDAGYDLTLRQLYYQFVSRDFIANRDSEYKKLGSVINDARLAGHISWTAIVDRTRFLRENSHWDSPADIVKACAEQFRIDTRETQENYIEVWIEKDALIGVIETACRDNDIPCFSCRGYVSQSAMWRAAQRIRAKSHNKRAFILHLGDHDPSGIDMTRDIGDRLNMFSCPIDVERIALTMDQIEQFDPPPNPAKLSDSRCAAYITEYGHQSWELDALDPDTLVTLITDRISELTDWKKLDSMIELQIRHKKSLQKVAKTL